MVKADKTTPIVFTAVTDPVGAGLVNDAEAPEANVTGVSDLQPVEPILELAKQFNPDAKTVGIVYNAGESNSVFLVEAGQEGRRRPWVSRSSRRRPATRPRSRPRPSRWSGASTPSPSSATTRPSRPSRPSSRSASENKIPLLAGDTDSVKRGAAAGYGFDYRTSASRPAYQAAKILGGTPIEDIPVEFAKNLQLSINETAAAAQGVTIPQTWSTQAVNKY